MHQEVIDKSSTFRSWLFSDTAFMLDDVRSREQRKLSALELFRILTDPYRKSRLSTNFKCDDRACMVLVHLGTIDLDAC
jgi:hypothetical protein